jgi:hypothetical protein
MRASGDILTEAEHELKTLESRRPIRHTSLALLRQSFVTVSRSYFSLAALTRRNELDESSRLEGLARLFTMRSRLEMKMHEEIRANADDLPILEEAVKDSFFGKSKKQGVSIRYALASCVPTVLCGGRCYAHDGRDRELLHIFRGVLNYYVGSEYESSNQGNREKILGLLNKAISRGVKAAWEDRELAAVDGYNRMPRIRFSHVGEMAATPDFTNALAREIKKRDSRVQCVLYTRHPKAKLLDSSLLVVNFTVEGANDSRGKYAPSRARIVNSSWDGSIHEGAEVNFLEHHVEKAAASKGSGSICPVTADHKQTPSCDLARCQKCFVDMPHR